MAKKLAEICSPSENKFTIDSAEACSILYPYGVPPRAHELAISTIANKIRVSTGRASSSQARAASESTVLPTTAARVSSSSRASSSSSSSQARTASESTVVPTTAAPASSSSSSSQARTASEATVLPTTLPSASRTAQDVRRVRSGRANYNQRPTTAGVSAAPATAVDPSSICCISGCSCTDEIVLSSRDKKYRCSFHHFQQIPASR